MHNLVVICQTNIISMLLMLVIMVSIRKNMVSFNLSDILFFYLCFAICMSSFVEMLTYLLDYRTFSGAIMVNRIINVLSLIVNTFSPYLWALYVHYKIFNNKKMLVKTAKILFLPFIIMVALCFANLFTDIFFLITNENVYQRADFYVLAIIIHYCFLLYSVVIIIRQRKSISSTIAIPLLGFLILPLIGTLLQYFVFGQSLLWISCGFSMIIIYNYVQNNYANIDFLTKIYNRNHLEKYLIVKCNKKRENWLVGLMIDLNDFKKINDTFGHIEGDIALLNCANILKDTLGYERYVARFAGDEFIALFDVNSETEISTIISDIHNAFTIHNEQSEKEYTLSLSIGYALYEDSQSPVEFIKKMDSSMYKEKRLQKK